MSTWLRHNRNHPCPLCGGHTDCRSNFNGGIHCRRCAPEQSPLGYHFALTDRQGFNVFYPDDGSRPTWATDKVAIAEWMRARAAETDSQALNRHFQPPDLFTDVACQLRPMSADERDAIASRLCVPLGVLDLLHMRFLPGTNTRGAAWVVPERDGAENVIAVNLRFANDSKRTYGRLDVSHRRGLFIPAGWLELAAGGPILIPEGASDVLALTAMGLPAIGRPSNTDGAAFLAELFKRHGLAAGGALAARPIIILGERDRKDDGKWPGLEGALGVAQTLRESLGRPIGVSLPPEPSKDARAFLKANASDIHAGRIRLSELGARLLANLEKIEENKPTDERARPFLHTTTDCCKTQQPDSLSNTLAEWTSAGPIDRAAFVEQKTREQKTECPSPRKGVMDHRHDEDRTIFYRVDCGSYECDHCLSVRRQTYCLAVRKHLSKLLDCGRETVFCFRCAVAEWPTIKLQLCRKNGSFFRLDDEDGILRTVVTTVEVSGRPVTEYQISAAVDLLCTGINAIRLRYQPNRTFDWSKDWAAEPLRKTNQEPSKWIPRGQTHLSHREMLAAAYKHDVPCEPWNIKDDPRNFCAEEFSKAEKGASSLINELTSKEVGYLFDPQSPQTHWDMGV